MTWSAQAWQHIKLIHCCAVLLSYVHVSWELHGTSLTLPLESIRYVIENEYVHPSLHKLKALDAVLLQWFLLSVVLEQCVSALPKMLLTSTNYDCTRHNQVTRELPGAAANCASSQAAISSKVCWGLLAPTASAVLAGTAATIGCSGCDEVSASRITMPAAR